MRQKEIAARIERLPFEVLTLDNGESCQAVFPKAREKVFYQSRYCEFAPVGWAHLTDDWYPLTYKVVTEGLQSLGLRRNPNIMTFPECEWTILDNIETLAGEDDWGGIWSALRPGSIKTLKQHCLATHQMETRAFLTAIYRPLFANSYRVKSQGVMMLKEI